MEQLTNNLYVFLLVIISFLPLFFSCYFILFSHSQPLAVSLHLGDYQHSFCFFLGFALCLTFHNTHNNRSQDGQGSNYSEHDFTLPLCCSTTERHARYPPSLPPFVFSLSVHTTRRYTTNSHNSRPTTNKQTTTSR